MTQIITARLTELDISAQQVNLSEFIAAQIHALTQCSTI